LSNSVRFEQRSLRTAFVLRHSTLVLRANRRHVDKHAPDELDPVIRVEHPGRNHPVDVLDCQAMHAGRTLRLPSRPRTPPKS
jgi:hypothetical protein